MSVNTTWWWFDYQSDQHCAKTYQMCWYLDEKFDYQSDQHCAKTPRSPGSSPATFDYQSDQHCAKTRLCEVARDEAFDYQSDQHCAKTSPCDPRSTLRFDYQSDQHCAKTGRARRRTRRRFDYQSDQHCAKTLAAIPASVDSLITSQINTAPKQAVGRAGVPVSLITSQINTAPKQNEAKRALNATIMKNAKRDKNKGVKFARVTSGRNTCAFCLMLAGRGAVYHTRESAGELGRFHRHCSCKIVPGYSGDKYDVLVDGHDPKKIENRLIRVEDQTGTARGTADFYREVSLRDPDWLLGDTASFPSYSDEKTEAKKKKDKDHPAELRTASRLSKNGFSAVFVDDEIPERDGEDGRSRVIGLPDLESGLEIKNVGTARSENTISKHVGRSKRKRGFTTLAIDISENPYLSDEAAQAMIANSLRRHGVKSAYMVGHDERAVLVKAK